jgi:predicted Abi (CAAX) family protease
MNKTFFRILFFLFWVGVIAVAALLFTPKPIVHQTSDYALTSQLAVNQPSYYPLQQTLDPKLYRSLDQWVGRLILPNPEEFQSNPSPDNDWAWLEIYQAPSDQQDLVGKKVRLGWQKSPLLERYLRLVTTDIKFTAAALKSEQQGNLIPTRLNGRSQVGPLQALAGARPNDDVIISFNKAQVTKAEPTTIQVEQMPLMVTGRFMGLVKILGEAPTKSKADIPKSCPGSPPCPSELMRVTHYNPKTSQFDGVEEVIRIPQQPLVSSGRFISTPRQLADSTEGQAGWYIYGAQGQDGLFTVQALQPRSLFQLKPTEQVFGLEPGLSYIDHGNWKDTPKRKGTAQQVFVDPHSNSPEVALAKWKEGDRGLGIHLFGGIGGKKGESVKGGTVTGHFSYFFSQVVRDPFTQELQWDITYDQVYAQNPQGILSGNQSWANYTGNLQRGWLNSRPISNVIIKLDVLQDYNFGGVPLSPLTELRRQLEIMMARYRTGDGTGNSSVSPAASCVQDSNQALYIAIETLKNQIQANSAIANWLKNHPDNPETQRFQRLVQLGERLEQVLVPRGVIRPDWEQNAEILAGVAGRENYTFTNQDTLANALLSWQTILPRVAHDIISRIFLEQGASLWFLRTNQVGGSMPEILPLAPTNLFGEVPILSSALRRIFFSMVLLPEPWEWGITVFLLFIYSAIAIPLGMKSGFLQWRPIKQKPLQLIKTLIFLFLCPALWEELVFRVILLPYPDELNSPVITFGLALLSLILFVLYHPFNALVFYKSGNPTFFQPVFLGLTALLGAICTVAYLLTGSLWTITILHWVVVVIWLLCLNGLSKFTPKNSDRLVQH